jgi:Zn-dependent peptidase ImmA (M78 family)/transcriptional regulator with XRE-family HTH domain
MIKNDRQYAVTKSHVSRLRELRQRIARDQQRANSEMGLFEIQTLHGELQQLSDELAEYEALKSGAMDIGALTNVDDLPKLLIRARIAAGYSQKDLADKLNLKEQQIQRYEASDYAGASLGRLQDIGRVLNIQFNPEIEQTNKLELDRIVKRLVRAGLHPDVVSKRLGGSPDRVDLLSLVGNVARVFGWTADALRGLKELAVHETPFATASFKTADTVDVQKLAIYAVYAHHLANLAAQTTMYVETKPLPADSRRFREEVAGEGIITFQTLLDCAWDHGITVLPLDDPGAFHGAMWKFANKPVVVLKQKNRTSGRWLFDLLHELWHVIQNVANADASVVDTADSLQQRSVSPEEKRANRFAMNVLLDNRPDDLAEQCVKDAKGKLELLAAATPRVAARARVPVSALAMHLAHLIDEDYKGLYNWWGPAVNLSRHDEDHWQIARDAFLERADFSRLATVDRDLLARALQEVV